MIIRSLALLFLTLAAFAQSPTGNIVGRLTDLSGARVPGATVRVKNMQTSEIRETASQSDGEFTIPNLAPGQYSITVEKQGFRRLEESGLVLEIDQTTCAPSGQITSGGRTHSNS